MKVSTLDALNEVQWQPERSHKVKKLSLHRSLFNDFYPLAWPALELLELLEGEREGEKKSYAADWTEKKLSACVALKTLVLRVYDFTELEEAENFKIVFPASLVEVVTKGNTCECTRGYNPDSNEFELDFAKSYNPAYLKNMGFKFATE